MQIPRIYTPQPLTAHQQIMLGSQGSQHILRVLRCRLGDSVIVFNGKGGEYKAQLNRIDKHQAVLDIQEYCEVDRESPLSIHLMQGISRGERMDYVIQKVVELGVQSITPLFTERTTVKLEAERLKKRVEHWKGIVISACEQTGRCKIPLLNNALSFSESLKQVIGKGFICDTESTKTIHTYRQLKNTVSLLIGPEGGFSPQEIQQAAEQGFLSLSLGPRILRTETAPVVAMTLLQSHGGDF